MSPAPRSVYVVDDDPVIRQVLEAVLKSGGYKVAVATNGDEAIGGVGKVKPDLIVLDAMMPGIDGFAVCEAIRADASLANQPYVLMLTAASSGTEGARAKAAGVDEVMAKPFNPAQLLTRLQEVLR